MKQIIKHYPMTDRLTVIRGYHVQDYSMLYNNAVLLVIYEGWHCSHIWKTLAWPHLFTKRGGFSPYKEFSPATFHWSACTMPGMCGQSIILWFSFYKEVNHTDATHYIYKIRIQILWYCLISRCFLLFKRRRSNTKHLFSLPPPSQCGNLDFRLL
jgi:hypothetical protein